MDTNMKYKKSGMDERIVPSQIFSSRVEEGNIPNTISYVKLWSWLTWKWKVISVVDTNMKYKKAGIEE